MKLLFLICILISVNSFSQSEPNYLLGSVFDDILGKEVSCFSPDTLTADILIDENSVVQFIAGKSIQLKKGFKVTRDNSFKAYLKDDLPTNESGTSENTLQCFYQDGKVHLLGLDKDCFKSNYEVYSSNGQLITLGKVLKYAIIDTDQLSMGVYFIRVQTCNNKWISKKFIVSR